jgi:ribosomal protein S5
MLGSNSKINNVYATIKALDSLKKPITVKAEDKKAAKSKEE